MTLVTVEISKTQNFNAEAVIKSVTVKDSNLIIMTVGI